MAKSKTNVVITSYAQAQALFATAKDPAKGKPLTSSRRLCQDGEDFYITHNGERIGTITKDDRLILQGNSARNQGLQRAWMASFGVSARYVKKGVYDVAMPEGPKPMTYTWGYDGVEQTITYTGYDWQNAKYVPYFDGVTFDLNNRQPIAESVKERVRVVVDDDKSKAWRKALATYKRRWKVMVVMGSVMGGVMPALQAMKGHGWNWKLRDDPALLADAIMDGDLSQDTVNALLSAARIWLPGLLSRLAGSPAQVEQAHRELLNVVESVVSSNRDAIRKHLGIIEDRLQQAA